MNGFLIRNVAWVLPADRLAWAAIVGSPAAATLAAAAVLGRGDSDSADV
jgi:hypothetical protein